MSVWIAIFSLEMFWTRRTKVIKNNLSPDPAPAGRVSPVCNEVSPNISRTVLNFNTYFHELDYNHPLFLSLLEKSVKGYVNGYVEGNI